jgi:hypothetical protein
MIPFTNGERVYSIFFPSDILFFKFFTFRNSINILCVAIIIYQLYYLSKNLYIVRKDLYVITFTIIALLGYNNVPSHIGKYLMQFRMELNTIEYNTENSSLKYHIDSIGNLSIIGTLCFINYSDKDINFKAKIRGESFLNSVINETKFNDILITSHSIPNNIFKLPANQKQKFQINFRLEGEVNNRMLFNHEMPIIHINELMVFNENAKRWIVN